jgi:hypothetical protein
MLKRLAPAFETELRCCVFNLSFQCQLAPLQTGYDGTRCVPTQQLLEELGDLIHVPIATADAAAVSLSGGVRGHAAMVEDEEVFDAGSLYFRRKRFGAWAASAPDKFTIGTSKYRGRAVGPARYCSPRHPTHLNAPLCV